MEMGRVSGVERRPRRLSSCFSRQRRTGRQRATLSHTADQHDHPHAHAHRTSCCPALQSLPSRPSRSVKHTYTRAMHTAHPPLRPPPRRPSLTPVPALFVCRSFHLCFVVAVPAGSHHHVHHAQGRSVDMHDRAHASSSRRMSERRALGAPLVIRCLSPARSPATVAVDPAACLGLMITTKAQPAFVAFKQTTAKQRQ